MSASISDQDSLISQLSDLTGCAPSEVGFKPPKLPAAYVELKLSRRLDGTSKRIVEILQLPLLSSTSPLKRQRLEGAILHNPPQKTTRINRLRLHCLLQTVGEDEP